jgi:hypothetical protein
MTMSDENIQRERPALALRPGDASQQEPASAIPASMKHRYAIFAAGFSVAGWVLVAWIVSLFFYARLEGDLLAGLGFVIYGGIPSVTVLPCWGSSQ